MKVLKRWLGKLVLFCLGCTSAVMGFDLQAHRGGRDARPENTLIAFAYAMEVGVSTLELDLQVSRDQQLIVSHDPYLNPDFTRDGQGHFVQPMQYDIRAMILADIKTFDVGRISPAAETYALQHGLVRLSLDGVRLPTLPEVFELVSEYGDKAVRFNIETKTNPDTDDPAHANSPDPETFVRLIERQVVKYGLEGRVTLQSFDLRTLRAMIKLNPRIGRVMLTEEDRGDLLQTARDVGASTLSPASILVTDKLLKEAHSSGMLVVPWTVNDPDEVRRLINSGVDGVISDRPWMVRNIMRQCSLELPTPTLSHGSRYHTGNLVGAQDLDLN